MFALSLAKTRTEKQMNFVVIPQEKLDFFESSISELLTLAKTKQPVNDSPKWINKKDAARQLNVCSKTLDTYLKKGIIPFTQFKSKIYIKASDIEAHLEKYYVTKS
jgi:hypothetical protein